MSDSPTRRTRLGAAAGLLGAAAAFTLIVGAGPAPSVFQLAGANEDISGNCDEAEHANDPECAGTLPTTPQDDSTTSSTVDDSSSSSSTSSTTADAPAADVRSIDAAGAGTVLVSVEGGSLRLIAATPTAGWRVEVEQSSGREVEVDFRAGTKRVQVNVEIEDGQVRERVRVRDDDGTDIRTEDGVVQDDNSNSGPGSGDDSSDDDDHSGSGHDGSDDDSSGSGSSGSGRDHPEDD